MKNPQVEQWAAVKRILRYLQETKTHGIHFQPGNKVDFRSYSDADWAGDHFDRKSTSEYAFIFIGPPISGRSKKQSSVSLSTSEAEYIALSLAVQEGMGIYHLLSEILDAACEPRPELKIFKDNQSCVKMTNNPVNHGRAKLNDIKYHHIRDEVKRGKVHLEYGDVEHVGRHNDKGTARTAPQGYDCGAWSTCKFAWGAYGGFWVSGNVHNPNRSNLNRGLP